MVALLVLLTVVVFLLVDGILHLITRQARASEHITPAKAAQIEGPKPLPPGLFVHPGHTWAEIRRSGLVYLGCDDFVSYAMGRVDRVVLRRTGEQVHRGESLLTLESQGRRLELPAPLSGVIERGNEDLDPGALGANWTYLFRPQKLAEEIGALKVGEQASTWMQAELKRMAAWIGQLVPRYPGMAIQDGGLPVRGVLAALDPRAWERFQEEFLHLQGQDQTTEVAEETP